MAEAVSVVKDPQRVAAGRRGMEVRWGNPANRKTVRLDSLTPDQRRLVLALVDAAKEAAPAATAETAQEVRDDAARPPETA